MKTLILTNNFHRTETKVKVDENGRIKNMKAALKRLCGMSDCQCVGCDQFNTGEVYESAEGVWKVR